MKTESAISADLHLNNSNFGKIDKNGLSFRTKDFMKAFGYFVNQCINFIKPKRVLILGDVYENSSPSNPVRKFFLESVRKLSQAGIQVEILVGNHDASYFSHALEPIIGADFPNVTVHYEASFVVYEDCAVIYLPHTEAVERRETTFKLLAREFQIKHSTEIAKAKASRLPIILLGHFGVCGVEMNDGILNHNKDDISLQDLADLEPDAVFLGHYHSSQELAVKGAERAMYVGSLERSTFNDKSEKKTFVLLQTEKGTKPIVSRIEYPYARPMIQVTGNAQHIQEEIENIKSHMAPGQDEPIVKVKFSGTITEYADFCKSKKDIRTGLSGAKYIAFEKDVSDPDKEAQADSVRDQIAKKGDVGSSDIIEIFSAYVKATAADPEECKAIIETAASVISSVNEKDKKDRGVLPGRTRIHGVKLHNFQLYGTEKNIVEFDQGCSPFFGKIDGKNEDWDSIREQSKEFLATLSDDSRKLISIIGKIEGDLNESNGSGKSSILDSISWAFYEKIVRDFFDKESSKGSSTLSVVRTIDDKPEKECFVEVLFSAGKSLYLIRRERKVSSSGNHSGGCFLYCLYSPEASESGSMTGRRGADAEQFINQLVSMDFDTFANSVMFGQSDADKFIRGTDKTKKEIFVKILGLTILDEYLKEARARKSALDKELVSLESQISALSSNMMTKEEVEDAEKRIETLTTEAVEAEKKVAKFTESINSMRADPVFDQERDIKSEVDKYKALVQQRLEEAKRSCKASLESKLAEEKAKVKYLYEASVANAKVNEAEDEVTRLTSLVDSFDEKACQKDIKWCEEAQKMKPTREDEKQKLLDRKQEISVAAAEKQGEMSSLNVSVGKFKKSLVAIGTKEHGVCPECQSSVSKSHIEEKIKAGEEEIKRLVAEKAEIEKPLAEIKTNLDNVNAKLENIALYTTKGANASTKIEENKGNIKALEMAKKSLEDAKSRKNSADSQVTTSSNTIDSHQSSINKANEDANKDNEDFANKIAELNKKMNDVVLPAKSKIENNIADAIAASNEATSLAKTKSSEKAGLEARIDVSKKTAAKVSSYQVDLTKKTAEHSRMSLVENGFGLDGIRVQIIEKYIPLLNVYIGEFMDVISDKMSMTVITDGKRDGKMEIKIKGSSASDPRQLSKGQFAKVKVATDLALGMMSLARNENAPDFVALDEVFAPVDTNGKKAMFDVITKLQEYFRMVLVISHDPIIQETIKDIIVVNMVNDTSTIEKQAFEH
jgi:DNA repair exonuclease SbcCD ATPase subunit/DNA repair exonuclease SbcCD nuclease subunit